MPTYEYECSGCGHEFEMLQSMKDAKLKKCPKCGKLKLHRLIGSGTGLIFKGSGFYETDYKRKEPSNASKSASSSVSKSPKPSPAPQSGPCSGGCACH